MKSDNFFGDDNSDDSIKDANEDRVLNDKVNQIVELAEQGANVSAMISSLPAHLQDKVKKRVAAVQQNQKQAQQKTTADANAKTGQEKKGLRALVGLMAKQAYDKIASTMKAKPDFQRKVQEAGRVLMRNGVIVDTVRISEADLGNLPPMVGVGQDKDKTVQR